MQASPPARDRFDDEHLLWLKSLLLYTTLVGLIGALWLKLQGYLLDHGADLVIRRMKWVMEFQSRRDPARPALFAHRSALQGLIDG